MKVLELARALAAEPRLLLLDEPAAGLPQAEAEHVGEIIIGAQRGSGVTVLLVEHNMRMVMSLSHEILVLNNGMRIAEGDAEQRAPPSRCAGRLSGRGRNMLEVDALTADTAASRCCTGFRCVWKPASRSA